MIRIDDRKIQLGRLPQQSEAGHVFHVRNDGTAPLQILKVEPDCGCTAFALEDSTLLPGQSTDLRVTLETRNYEGEQTKIIAVYTNDPAEPRIDLVLYADVKPFIQVEPRYLDFGKVRRGDTPTLTSRLTADAGLGFKVLRVKGGEDVVTWKILPLQSDGGDTYALEARIKPDAPFGHLNARCDATVVHPKSGLERLYIRGDVYSYFFADRGGIKFGGVGTGQRVSAGLKIAADGGKPYRIVGVTSPVPYLKAALSPAEGGYTLNVTLDAPDQPLTIREDLVLKTTDPAQPELLVEVRAVVRDAGAGGTPKAR